DDACSAQGKARFVVYIGLSCMFLRSIYCIGRSSLYFFSLILRQPPGCIFLFFFFFLIAFSLSMLHGLCSLLWITCSQVFSSCFVVFIEDSRPWLVYRFTYLC